MDTRFSRFTRNNDDDDTDYDDDMDDEYEDENYPPSDDNVISGHIDIGINGDESQIPEAIFNALEGFVNNLTGLAGKNIEISTDIPSSAKAPVKQTQQEEDAPQTLTRLLVFDSLNTVINASKQVASFYFSSNTLYKNPVNKRFYLLFTNDKNTIPEFNRVCYILGEYGTAQKITDAMPYHFKEHFKTIIEEEAVQTLSAL